MVPGSVVFGRFRLVRVRGQGGMATVYEAVDEEAGRRVALKVVTGNDDVAARLRARLRLEARALGTVSHASVVGYRGHGIEPDAAWLALEWVEGDTLAERLSDAPLSAAESIVCAARIARALAATHAVGLVHRDVKPSNVLLREGAAEAPVLVDFGIARADRTVLTATGSWVGTPRYMAPEQVQDAHYVDGRADVFSLATVLYEMLTREPAFAGRTTAAVLARVLFERPASLGERLTAAPPALVSLVDTALSKTPEGRPGAKAFAEALEALLDEEQGLAQIGPSSAPATQIDARAPGDEPTVTSARALVRSGLAAPKETFGRAALLSAIDGALSDGPLVVGLWGAPGAGKSHVALVSASKSPSALRARLPSGRADDLARALADALGIVPTSLATPSDLAGWLDRESVDLVLLDDVPALHTELVDAIAAVRWHAPSVRWLATTQVHPEDDRVLAIEVAPLLVRDAAELFLALASEAGKGSLDRGIAERVASALDGLPGAVAIAAREVVASGAENVLARLEADADAAPSIARRALENALASVPARQRRILAYAALFENACRISLLEATLSAEDRHGLDDDLAALRKRGLLRLEGADDAPAIRVLTTVRALLRRTLEEADVEQAYARAGAALLEIARPHAAAARATGEPRAMASLAELRPDALVVIERLLRSGPRRGTLALGLTSAFAPLLLARGEPKTLARLVSGLERIAFGAIEDRRTLRILAARADMLLGERVRALDVLTAATADAAEDAGDLLLDSGIVLHGLRRYDEAQAAYERAAARLSHRGDLVGAARAWGNLGALAHDRGRSAEAEGLYQRAIFTLEAKGEERLRGAFLGNLAVLVQERGAVADARSLYGGAIELLARSGDVRLEGIARGNFGLLEHEQGRLAEAVAAHETASTLLARTGDVRSESLALGRLAAALADHGRVSRAQGVAAEGLRLALRQDDPLLVPFFQLVSAFCHRARAAAGDPSSAQSAAEALARVTARTDGGGEALLERSDDARTLHRIFVRARRSHSTP